MNSGDFQLINIFWCAIFLIKNLKSLTYFSSNMAIIYLFIYFGICIKQKFSIIPHVTSFCLIHGITIWQESNVFVWKDSRNELRGTQHEYLTLFCFMFSNMAMIIQELFTVVFPMWSNDHGSKCPTVSVRWQNRSKTAWQEVLIINMQVLGERWLIFINF